MKENEIGGTCGTHEREEENVQGLGGKRTEGDRRKETTRKTKAQMGSEWIMVRLDK
jgi:hypothetical protein